MTGPILTPRLALTPLVDDDAPRLLEYRSHPDVLRFQLFAPVSAEDALRFIRESAGGPGRWRQLGIRLREPEALVGDVGYRVDAEQRDQAEVGVTVAPDHQRQGIGREALEGLLAHLFGELGLRRVYASVDPRNTASMTLFEHAGMRREAWFRQSVRFRGEWADDVVFAMLDHEWEPDRRGAVDSA